MKKIILLLFVLTAFTVTNSCKRDKHIPNICFERDILPIFVVKCGNTGCHAAGAKDGLTVLTNYTDIMKGIAPYHASKSEIFKQIKGKNPLMPTSSSPQLTAKEVDLIKSWIDFGALNISCGIGTGTPSISNCDTLTNNTYNGKIKAILDVNCNGCHFTGNFTGHTLDTYNGAKTSVNTGKLIISIKHLGSKNMPQSATKLSDCTIAKIDKWIKLGMPEM